MFLIIFYFNLLTIIALSYGGAYTDHIILLQFYY